MPSLRILSIAMGKNTACVARGKEKTLTVRIPSGFGDTNVDERGVMTVHSRAWQRGSALLPNALLCEELRDVHGQDAHLHLHVQR